MLNSGTHRGGAEGFRLDTLLRLPDIKASDRKTSLLQFVISKHLPAVPGLATMGTQLAIVKAAANIQVRTNSATTWVWVSVGAL